MFSCDLRGDVSKATNANKKKMSFRLSFSLVSEGFPAAAGHLNFSGIPEKRT